MMREDDVNGGCDERGCRKGGCGRLLGMECVEREGEGRGLVQVEGSDSKQSEMNVQCEQIISIPSPFTTYTSAHMDVGTVLSPQPAVWGHRM